MVTVPQLFQSIETVRVLVVGDLLFDVYTKGKVERISPEAPVPILRVSNVSKLPGGAGNVALNLQALGAKVTLISRVGNDPDGKEVCQLLNERSLSTQYIFEQEHLKTFVKNRFMADGQQLIRADYEEVIPLSQNIEISIMNAITKMIFDYDLIAISDYAKGLLSEELLQFIIQMANRIQIPIIVDPKGADFTKYRGTYLLKPNNREAYQAAGCELSEPIEVVAKKLFEKIEMSYLLITRSEKGMILFSRDLSYQNFPVLPKDIRDVTGAGDTALAMLAMGLANNLSFEETISLAIIASSIAIERTGCATIKLSEIAKRLCEKDPTNKIISHESQIFILEKALEDKPILYLFLEENEISTCSLNWIREIATQKEGRELVVHINSRQEGSSFVHLLASMSEIDYVLVLLQTQEKMVRHLNPAQVMTGGGLEKADKLQSYS